MSMKPTTWIEADLRSHGFREGYKVKLGDGQEWTFPKPRLRFRAARSSDGNVGLGGGWEHDAEYQRLRDALIDCDSTNTYDLINLQVQIAANLLLRNYDLSDDALGDLLVVDFEDDANTAMWDALAPVIFANPPKASADGSAVV